MSKVIVLGGGFAGHTAALYLRKLLSRDHEVHVISGQSYFQYHPSLVWVGVGHISAEDTFFELAPVYQKQGVRFTNSAAEEINVEAQSVILKNQEVFQYDFLINATGPYLNFEGTEGMDLATGNTHSICTVSHAIDTKKRYLELIDKMREGKKQTIVIGTGHPASTCHGAAFEYIQNVHYDLVAKGLRNQCELIWFTNEPKLGDFGMGAFVFKVGGNLRYTNNSGEDLKSQLCNPGGFLKVDGDYTSASKNYDQWSATKFQKYLANNVIYQIYRFAVINYTMLRTIFHNHG